MKILPLALVGSLAIWSVSAGRAAETPADFGATTDKVGQQAAVLETPVNQRVTPAGKLVELPAVRPNALALSPDRELLVTSGLVNELLVLSPATGETLQRVPFPTGQAAEQAAVSPLILGANKAPKLSFTGLVFSADGSRVYLSDVNGAIRIFAVAKDRKVTALHSLGLPPADAPARKAEFPPASRSRPMAKNSTWPSIFPIVWSSSIRPPGSSNARGTWGSRHSPWYWRARSST